MTAFLYCQCDSPIMDLEHDEGCRRCGRPVDFSPARLHAEMEQLRARVDLAGSDFGVPVGEWVAAARAAGAGAAGNRG